MSYLVTADIWTSKSISTDQGAELTPVTGLTCLPNNFSFSCLFALTALRWNPNLFWWSPRSCLRPPAPLPSSPQAHPAPLALPTQVPQPEPLLPTLCLLLTQPQILNVMSLENSHWLPTQNHSSSLLSHTTFHLAINGTYFNTQSYSCWCDYLLIVHMRATSPFCSFSLSSDFWAEDWGCFRYLERQFFPVWYISQVMPWCQCFTDNLTILVLTTNTNIPLVGLAQLGLVRFGSSICCFFSHVWFSFKGPREALGCVLVMDGRSIREWKKKKRTRS